mmetsp:Transcript_67022/g.139691  ORF Transcript_67022/g.139691 Transcript_67022/m.139691 type:complete len:195 (-) Transcript_67022:164-748(-)
MLFAFVPEAPYQNGTEFTRRQAGSYYMYVEQSSASSRCCCDQESEVRLINGNSFTMKKSKPSSMGSLDGADGTIFAGGANRRGLPSGSPVANGRGLLSESPRETMQHQKCTSCQSRVSKNSRICPVCGERISYRLEGEQKTEEIPPQKPLIWSGQKGVMIRSPAGPRHVVVPMPNTVVEKDSSCVEWLSREYCG